MTALTADRHARLLRKWNITQEMWDAVWEAQRGRCYICDKPFSSNRLPCVDHDHESGMWRGLLCTHCNYALGERHDDLEWFQRATTYLECSLERMQRILGRVHYVPGSIGEYRAAQR